jgi:hypothetical protein
MLSRYSGDDEGLVVQWIQCRLYSLRAVCPRVGLVVVTFDNSYQYIWISSLLRNALINSSH